MTEFPKQNLRPLRDVKLENPTYWWYGRFIVGTRFNLLAGPSGKGKSLTTAKIAADASNGIGMPKKKATPSIFLNLEDAPSISRARIEAAGGDIDKILIPNRPYMIPDDIARLEEDVLKLTALHGVPPMLYFDTASKVITAPIKNDQKVAQALYPFTQMVERTKTCAMFVTHTLKGVSRNQDPLLAVGGAVGGLVGSAATVALFGVMPNDDSMRGLAWVKNSYGPNPDGMTFTIESVELYDDKNRIAATAGVLQVVDPVAEINPIDLIAGRAKSDQEQSAPAQDQARTWLYSKLCDGPRLASELEGEAAKEGLSWTGAIRRTAKKEGIEKPRDGYQGAVYWRLPDGHEALSPIANNKTPNGK